MKTKTYRACDLFAVRSREPLLGNPTWANLTIESNRSLPQELAQGAGLYAVHYRDRLLYIGKFLGKRTDAFGGRICHVRWAKHMGTLTLRDRRVSLAQGPCKLIREMQPTAAPLSDIVEAMQVGTLHHPRGRVSSLNRASFAAEQWRELSRIDDASGLANFMFTYTQVDPQERIAREIVRDAVSRAEKMAIERLRPRCNAAVREGTALQADVRDTAAALTAALEDAFGQLGGGGEAPPPPGPPGNGGDPDAAEGADDPDDRTAEETFWERIDDDGEAEYPVQMLIESLADIADADFHFTMSPSNGSSRIADLRIHSLAGRRERFNVGAIAWQPALRRFKAKIGLSVTTCMARGAMTALPKRATLETVATFDVALNPAALRDCMLAALNAHRHNPNR
jgi:hypothetical protein